MNKKSADAPETSEGLEVSQEAGGIGDMSFEELVGSLEALTQSISSGEIGIEEATDLYERAQLLYSAASVRLDKVRQRIEIVEGGGATG